MKNYLIFLIIVYIFTGCSARKDTIKKKPEPIPEQTQVEKEINKSPNIIKENSTLVAAIIDTVEIIDDLYYRVNVKINTAIPDNWNVVVIEPGQEITVLPDYRKNEENNVDLSNPINQKIFEIRNLKKKGMFIGKVTLAPDNNYYLTMVETYQQAPED